MAYPTTRLGYQCIGTLRETPPVRVQIVSILKQDATQYLMNEIEILPQTLPLLEQCLACFSSKKYPNFVSFFSETGRFFLLFHHNKATNLRMGFQGNPDGVSVGRRFILLQDILLKLHESLCLPLPLTISAAAAENISINDRNEVELHFVLEPELVLQEIDNGMLYDRIALLIRLMLEAELENKQNQALHIIVRKCEKHLYESIPELVKELQSAEENSNGPSLSNWFAGIRKRNERKLRKATTLATVLITLCVLVYLSISLFSPNNRAVLNEKVLQIGNMTYVADESAASTLSPSLGQSIKQTDPVLSMRIEDEMVDFEDHVVRTGETLDSICESYYGNSAYKEAVANFNGMEKDTMPEAGTIIKLPNPEGIAVE